MSGGRDGGGRGRKSVNKSSIPWLRDFAPARAYSSLLDEEVDAFSAFTSLTASELQARNDLVAEVSAAASEAHPMASAGLSGHAAIGIILPQSDVAVDVNGLDAADAPRLGDALQRRGFLIEGRGASWLRIRHGDTAAVVGLRDGTPALARALQRRNNMAPLVGKIVKVLAQVLRQSNLLGGEGGGVPQFALFVMVSAALQALKQRQQQQQQRQEPSATAAPRGANHDGLVEAVAYYAHRFDPATTVLTCAGPQARTAEQPGDKLWVASPTKNGANLAEDCVRWVQVREVLKYCDAMLGKWEGGKWGGQGAQSRRQPYSYKGKSPLSSIIAFKRLSPAKPALPPPAAVSAAMIGDAPPPCLIDDDAAPAAPGAGEQPIADLARLCEALQAIGAPPAEEASNPGSDASDPGSDGWSGGGGSVSSVSAGADGAAATAGAAERAPTPAVSGVLAHPPRRASPEQQAWSPPGRASPEQAWPCPVAQPILPHGVPMAAPLPQGGGLPAALPAAAAAMPEMRWSGIRPGAGVWAPAPAVFPALPAGAPLLAAAQCPVAPRA